MMALLPPAVLMLEAAVVGATTTPQQWQMAGGNDVSWLAVLQEPSVLAELQAIADHDLTSEPSSDSQFVGNFGPNGDLAKEPGTWMRYLG